MEDVKEIAEQLQKLIKQKVTQHEYDVQYSPCCGNCEYVYVDKYNIPDDYSCRKFCMRVDVLGICEEYK